jgi:hypothetical protein
VLPEKRSIKTAKGTLTYEVIDEPPKGYVRRRSKIVGRKRTAAAHDDPNARAYQLMRQIMDQAKDPSKMKILDVRCRGGAGRKWMPLDCEYTGVAG